MRLRAIRAGSWIFCARNTSRRLFSPAENGCCPIRIALSSLMSDPLFEVANHTWEHRNLRLLTGQALVDEIRGASLAYERVRANILRQSNARRRMARRPRARPTNG